MRVRGAGIGGYDFSDVQPHADRRVARNEKKARVFSASVTPLCQQVVEACCFNHVYICTSIRTLKM